MKYIKHLMVGVGALFFVFVTGCFSPAPDRKDNNAATEASLDLNILVFGDSGYHPKFPKKSEFTDVYKTPREYYEADLHSLKGFGGTEQDYIKPLIEISPVTGGYVLSSGLTRTSNAMKEYCEKNGCDFAFMLGDNIYPVGADGLDDEDKFSTLFHQPFADLGQGDDDFRIYVTLGNHDWSTSREGALAQVAYMENTQPFYMDGLFYTVKPPSAHGMVEVFVIDTEILLSSTKVYQAKLDKNAMELPSEELKKPYAWAKPATEQEKKMRLWLDEKLKNSTAKWKIVVGHHTLWSTSGKKFQEGYALRKMILPSLCKYADAYFAGHEHTLEIHEDDCRQVLGAPAATPLPLIVSGSAAKQRPVYEKFMLKQQEKHPELKTLWAKGMLWGFSVVKITDKDMTVKMIGLPENPNAAAQTVYTKVFPHRSR